MTKDKARQWDGKSRPTNDIYKKRWEEIFGKKEEEDNGTTEETDRTTD
jgi:hypothetical protein